MMKFKVLSFILISWILMCGVSSSELIFSPLKEMIARSETIILGRVLKIEKTSKSESKVSIAVEETIKGGKQAGDVVVIYLEGKTLDEPHFSINEQCFLFVDSDGEVVNLSGGKVNVRDGKVEARFEEQEAGEDLRIFIKKIRDFSD